MTSKYLSAVPGLKLDFSFFFLVPPISTMLSADGKIGVKWGYMHIHGWANRGSNCVGRKSGTRHSVYLNL